MANVSRYGRRVIPVTKIMSCRCGSVGSKHSFKAFRKDVPKRTIKMATLQINKTGAVTDGGQRSYCPKCGSVQPSSSEPNAAGKWFVECVSCKRWYTTTSGTKDVNPEETKKTPKKIYQHLEKYVIGQTYAKKVLATQVYNHYKRVEHNLSSPNRQQRNSIHKDIAVFSADSDKFQDVFRLQESISGGLLTAAKPLPQTTPVTSVVPDDRVKLEKSNILMLGPTGSGKTYIASKLAEYLDVPFAICDCTSLTTAGYVGEDIESAISKLLQAANNDIERCERGIVLLDEIDKITKTRGHIGVKDVGGLGVQQGMLKMLEGTIINVPEGFKKHPKSDSVQVNTENILFIGAGAFTGIEKIVQKRTAEKVYGFLPTSNQSDETESSTDEQVNNITDEETAATNALLKKVQSQDLVEFGMIPEFCGRMPILVPFHLLDVDCLGKILTEPKDAIISQYKHIFGMDGCELEFEKAAIEAIAEIAQQKKTGARGLRWELEKILMDAMFEIPGSNVIKVTVTEDCVRGKSPLVYTVSEQEDLPEVFLQQSS